MASPPMPPGRWTFRCEEAARASFRLAPVLAYPHEPTLALAMIRGSLFRTPGRAVAGSFKAAAWMVPVSRFVASHLFVWDYVLYRAFSDARHRDRPHSAHSPGQAFVAAARWLGTGAP